VVLSPGWVRWQAQIKKKRHRLHIIPQNLPSATNQSKSSSIHARDFSRNPSECLRGPSGRATRGAQASSSHATLVALLPLCAACGVGPSEACGCTGRKDTESTSADRPRAFGFERASLPESKIETWQSDEVVSASEATFTMPLVASELGHCNGSANSLRQLRKASNLTANSRSSDAAAVRSSSGQSAANLLARV